MHKKLKNSETKLLCYIVDDTDLNKRYMEALIKEALYEHLISVRIFDCPEEVLKESVKDKPDIIISDHYFGDNSEMTGTELLRSIRKNNKEILLYLSSDLSKDEIEEKVLSIDATGYFSPSKITKEELRDKIIKDLEKL